MTAAKTAEGQQEREIEVYPAAELVNAINRIISEPPPVKIAIVSNISGDIAFTCTLNELGILRSIFQHPFYRSPLFANLLSELIIRANMFQFCETVMGKDYWELSSKYQHTRTGMRIDKNDTVMFQIHMSLLKRLVDESITNECADEIAKVNIISSSRKIKRDEQPPSITSYCDDPNNFRLIVSNHSSVRHCFQHAIRIILDFFNIKGKEVFITQNMFSIEIQITDANKKTQ